MERENVIKKIVDEGIKSITLFKGTCVCLLNGNRDKIRICFSPLQRAFEK